MDEDLVIDSLQTSRFAVWRGKILSDHFQCPCDAINTFQGKVPAYLFEFFGMLVSLRNPSIFGGEEKLYLFSK